MMEYLKGVDLADAKVAAFCTHDGGGGKGLFKRLAQLVPGGLVETLELKKPRAEDPALELTLEDWVGRLREALGTAGA